MLSGGLSVLRNDFALDMLIAFIAFIAPQDDLNESRETPDPSCRADEGARHAHG